MKRITPSKFSLNPTSVCTFCLQRIWQGLTVYTRAANLDVSIEYVWFLGVLDRLEETVGTERESGENPLR